jgi:tetraacyldisaccharide 4'-kinase
MYIKGNSTINRVILYGLNLFSFFFKLVSLIYLKIKSIFLQKYPVLIISVDNLSFGGTGKTSLVMTIGREFEKRALKFAIVTRGYKSEFEYKNTKVQNHHSVGQVGDEAKLFKANFPQHDVYIGKDRKKSIESAIEDENHIIILDDGFQSTHVHRDIKIMLYNPSHPYHYLRNFKFLMKREDIILFYKYFSNREKERFKTSECETYDFYLEKFFDKQGKEIEVEKQSLLGFSALGDNKRFREDLLKYSLKDFLGYRDHHLFTEEEISQLDGLRKEKKIDLLVCTEKDFIKIQSMKLKNIPLIYTKNRLKFSFDLLGYLVKYAQRANQDKTLD